MARKSGPKCPNINHPEFKRLDEIVPGQAYTIWDMNEGFGVEQASNGEPSLLYNELLELFKGDETAATKAKARIYTQEYIQLTKDSIVPLDENGEPKLTITRGGWVHINGLDIATIKQDDNEQGVAQAILQEYAEPEPIDEEVLSARDRLQQERLSMLERLDGPDSQQFVNRLATKIEKNSAAIISGIRARIRTLKQYESTPKTVDKIQTLERELAKYEEMYENSLDQKLIVEFIRNVNKENQVALKGLLEAQEELRKTGKFSMRTDRLVQLNSDFLGFYTTLVNDIHRDLFSGRYFENLTEGERVFIKESLESAMTAFSEMTGIYNDLLLSRVSDILKAAGDKINSPTIDSYLKDRINHTDYDVDFWHRWVGGLKDLPDEAMKLIHNMVVDLNNKTQREAIAKINPYFQLTKKLGLGEQLSLYEKDSKGKNTGRLVRDRNFGEHNMAWDAFQKELGPAPINDPVALKDWRKKRNDWHSEHSERQYMPAYYDIYNELSQKATNARDEINNDIRRLLNSVTDKNGNINREDFSAQDWAKLEYYYILKKGLASKYNFDGTDKGGVELEIADEFRALNAALGKNLQFKMNTAKFNELVDRKREQYRNNPEKFQKWYDRSTRIGYTESFIKMLEKMDKVDYGTTYNDLAKDRREFLGLFRTNKSPQVDADRMGDAAKAKVRVMDKALMAERDRRTGPKKKSAFGNIAEIATTDRYLKDKNAAITRSKTDPAAYDQWRLENHYFDSKGVMHPYSYYTYMKPKSAAHMEVQPSMEFSEIDENSPFINRNFDSSYQEKYVPKKSKYNNEKAYEEVMNNPKRKAVYDATVDLLRNANKEADLGDRSPYLLPQLSGTAFTFMKAQSSFLKGLKSYWKDALFLKNDDIEYKTREQYITRPDGSRVPSLPRHFVKMLNDPSTISADLAGMMSSYVHMATQYANRRQVMPEFEALAQWVDKRTYAPKEATSTIGRATQGIGRALSGIGRAKGAETQMSARVRLHLDMHVYGESRTPMTVGVNKEGDQFSFGKLFAMFKNYSTTTKLGVNLQTWVKNFTVSLQQNAMESLGGRHYDKATSAKASWELSHQMVAITSQVGDYAASNKVMSLMNHFRVVRDMSRDYEKLNYARVGRAISNHFWYSGMTAGDYAIKSHNLLAVMMSHKFIPSQGFMTKYEFADNAIKEKLRSFMTEAEYHQYMYGGTTFKRGFQLHVPQRGQQLTAQQVKENARMQSIIDQARKVDFKKVTREAGKAYDLFSTPSVYDILESDGITVKVKDKYKSMDKYFTEQLQNKISNTSNYLNQRADSQLSEEEKGAVHRNVLASFLLMLRQWIVQAIDDRFFRDRAWNPMTQGYDEAMYVAAFRAGLVDPLRHNVQMLKYYSRRLRGATPGQRHQKQQMTPQERYYVRRVSRDIATQIVYQMILASFIRSWWEEDPYDWKRAFLKLVTISTLREEGNLYDAVDTFRSLKTVTPASDEIDNFLDGLTMMFFDSDREILYGAYQGWPAWSQKMFKVTPLRNIWELQDPNAKSKYIESQLTTGSMVDKLFTTIRENITADEFVPKFKESPTFGPQRGGSEQSVRRGENAPVRRSESSERPKELPTVRRQ